MNIIKKKINPKIEISVVIATFNRAQNLKKTVESILNQSDPVFEILVIDDGSTDSTKEVVSKFGNKVRYIYTKHCGRPSIPRNIGIKASKGNYIAFCDDDDLWLKNKIQLQKFYIKKFRSKVICSNAYHLQNGSKTKILYFKDLFFFIDRDQLFFENKLILSSVLIEKHLLNNYIFDQSRFKRAVEDYDLWMKISRLSLIFYINKPLVYYEINSISKISIEKKYINFFKLLPIKIKNINFKIIYLIIKKFLNRIKKLENRNYKHKDLVSVIMPVYNSDKFLKYSIESILNQSHKNIEFLILDDHSTDRSYEILKSYQKFDSRIKVFRNKKNYGISYSLNKLIKHVNGNYIARMDSDDISMKDRLNIQVEIMKKNRSIDILSSGIKYFGHKNYKFSLLKSHDDIKFLLPLINIINHPTVFIKYSKKIKKNLIYQSKYDGIEDWVLWNNLVKQFNFFSSEKIVLFYRSFIHNKNHLNKRMVIDSDKALNGNNNYQEFLIANSVSPNTKYDKYKTFFIYKNFNENFKNITIKDIFYLIKLLFRRFFYNEYNPF